MGFGYSLAFMQGLGFWFGGRAFRFSDTKRCSGCGILTAQGLLVLPGVHKAVEATGFPPESPKVLNPQTASPKP